MRQIKKGRKEKRIFLGVYNKDLIQEVLLCVTEPTSVHQVGRT